MISYTYWWEAWIQSFWDIVLTSALTGCIDVLLTALGGLPYRHVVPSCYWG